MTHKQPFEETHHQLIEQLQQLPLHQPPPGLGTEILARIRQRPAGRRLRLTRLFSAPAVLTFRPAVTVCLAAMLIGAFVLGRFSTRITDADPLQLADAEAAYLAGRELLAAEKRTDALALLRHAARLSPENPEFALWEGIAHWTNDQPDQERASYLRGLRVAPDSLPLLVNLGHHHLSNGDYQQALDSYAKVLTIAPEEPAAWYNSGLIYRQLGQKEQEIAAWKNYLHRQRLGIKALRAVERLNGAGDFSYRAYWIGTQRVIVHAQALLAAEPLAADLQHEAAMLAAMLTDNQALTLTITTFCSGDANRARHRALLFKRLIAETATSPVDRRIAVSWFDSPETIPFPGKEQDRPAEDLLLFGSSTHQQNKEVSI
ncbi:MAG: tetratricopeptide repeat protein [Desulfofustis sp.]|jgi:tetratricopeptide (TPR) repeat protein|nr:tetratricopeptide repeat protein [Desulfofustis sp.]